MKILIIHQNFPGQYKHLAPALVARGDEVVALTPKVEKPVLWQGVKVLPYKIARGNGQGGHPWMTDLETKVIRAEACFHGARALAAQGFVPDVILAHYGWGEPMFLKDVWPEARLGLYCELYHQAKGADSQFDPEFPPRSPETEPLRMRLRNLNSVLHFDIGDAGISPTRFQAETFPPAMRERIAVCHDGIDTDHVRPDPSAMLDLGEGRRLTRADEVISFINRNLEPYRGYHIFMRALPELLRARPAAQVVLLGGDEVSYGAAAPQGKSWKQIFIDEVRSQISEDDWARVHFLGRVPYTEFLSLMQVARVHVYLTYPFVLSWSLLEAMSAECAIVASETAPVREVLEHGRTGRLVDFFDGAALVREVSALLDDPGARARLGAAARADVVAGYDLKRVCLPQQLAWVDSLAAMPARRSSFDT